MRGLLDKHLLDAVLAQLREAPAPRALSIDSDGGQVGAALGFVTAVKEAGLDDTMTVRIHHAASAAAFVALSLGTHRLMRRGTTLDLHRGSLTLETVDYEFDGKVPERLLARTRDYLAALDGLLQGFGLYDPHLLGTFLGSGWLKLTDEQCLRFGLVQELF